MEDHSGVTAAQFTERDKKRMASKPRQLVRFVALNLKILKAVDRSKRS